MSQAARRRAARRRAGRRDQSLPLMPLLVGGIVVLGVVAVILVARSDEASPNDQTRPVTVEGTPLTPLPEDGTGDDQVGAVAPTLRGEDFSGQPVEIAPDGRPKAGVFLAHWCPHCNNEAPRLAAFLRESGLPEGVDLYVVATGTKANEPNYPPDEWLDEMGLAPFDLPTLVDSEDYDAYVSYGQAGFPYVVALDGDNRVLVRMAGELPEGAFGPFFASLGAGETPVDPRVAG